MPYEPSKQMPEDVLELSIKPSFSSRNAIQGYSRCFRCIDLVLCRSWRSIPQQRLIHFLQTDNLISGARSTVPFSKAECEELSRLVREMDSKPLLSHTALLLYPTEFLGQVRIMMGRLQKLCSSPGFFGKCAVTATQKIGASSLKRTQSLVKRRGC